MAITDVVRLPRVKTHELQNGWTATGQFKRREQSPRARGSERAADSHRPNYEGAARCEAVCGRCMSVGGARGETGDTFKTVRRGAVR